MRNRSIIWVCALLLFAGLMPVKAFANTGEVTCYYYFHQSYLAVVNDLHLEIAIDSDSELISVNWVGIDPPATTAGYTTWPGDDGFDVDFTWDTPVPYCTWVRVRINITLKGTVCTNQQELVSAIWTFDGAPVNAPKIPPHKWKMLRRYFTPGGANDIYPFELINTGLTDLYIRNLEFGLLNYDLVDDVYAWLGWDPALYTGGDFSLLPGNSLGMNLTTDRWIYPPHVYGHWEMWSGDLPADSLIGEAWMMHYDHEPSLAAQMGTFEVLFNGDGSRTVNWSTLAENSVAGFNIYRANTLEDERLLVNDALIPAMGSDVNGADYSVVDRGIEMKLDCFYWVENITVDGDNSMHGPFLASGKEEAPDVFALYQNYPNPFNPNTIIEYNLSNDCHVKLDVFNVAGQRIATLMDSFEKAGRRSVSWDGKDSNGSDVVSGVYLYRLTVGSETEFKKMILMR